MQPGKNISVTRAADLLGVGRMTVLRMIESGQIEASRLHDRGWWQVSRASVMGLIERTRIKFALGEEPARKAVRGRQSFTTQRSVPVG